LVLRWTGNLFGKKQEAVFQNLNEIRKEKLITTCIILCCLLTPLKGYSDVYDRLERSNEEHGRRKRLEDKLAAANRNRREVLISAEIGILILARIYFWNKHNNNFREAEGSETAYVEKALDFYCNNAQLVSGQAFMKYQGYLSVIANFLTKYPKNQKFRNDLKTVFEMSQNDNRLTPKEKQEITNKFTSNYKFLLPEKQAI
jgi:hypothetical protein